LHAPANPHTRTEALAVHHHFAEGEAGAFGNGAGVGSSSGALASSGSPSSEGAGEGASEGAGEGAGGAAGSRTTGEAEATAGDSGALAAASRTPETKTVATVPTHASAPIETRALARAERPALPALAALPALDASRLGVTYGLGGCPGITTAHRTASSAVGELRGSAKESFRKRRQGGSG